eukprot:COSAG02_NODE_20918_length_810_cov_0.459916_1_plen_156_part_01
MPPADGGAPWRPFCGVGRCLSLVSEQGAFDALCPPDRLAPPSAICTLLTLCLPAFNAELENMRLGRPPIPTGTPQTGCKRGGVVGVIAAAPSTVALGDSFAPACGDRADPGGYQRRDLHLGRGGRPALVGATPPTLLFFFTQKTAYEIRIRDWSSD